MTTTLTILRAARELLSDEKRWCRGAYARDAAGNMWNGRKRNQPESWCLIGAVMKCAPRDDGGTQAAEAAQLCLSDIVGDSLAHWNDNPVRRHSDVIALLDEAIAREAAR